MDGEIAPPVRFTRNLDLAEQRAIERRLAELQPYVSEAAALRKRLANVHRRLGVESNSAVVERSILDLLEQNGGRLPRGIIIRDLGLPDYVVKAGLERLTRKGKIVSPERGYWVLSDDGAMF